MCIRQTNLFRQANLFRPLPAGAILMGAILLWAPILQGQGGGGNPFPGGENADGSLRPTARLRSLFTQDSYTEYALLEPGTGAFRIRFFTEVARAGATEVVNATRGGSEGDGIEVYDPRTGLPLPFTYEAQGASHAIRARLTAPVPEGGTGRVLIYKTYTDPRTYQTYSEAIPSAGVLPGDISWGRSLSGYRLGVILPPGYAFLSSNVAAQLSTLPDGRLKIHFANPSGLSNPLTIHARKVSANPKSSPFADMFFDDVKTLYDLGDPAARTMQVEQVYSDFRRGERLPLDLLGYAPLTNVKVTDLDTALPLEVSGSGATAVVQLAIPITNDKQSAHLKVEGQLRDVGYSLVDGELVFERTLKGLRNTILLPPGWEVSSVSQSGTLGVYQGRAFVALINLNSENSYRVRITARKS
jgi:hypothetical protein